MKYLILRAWDTDQTQGSVVDRFAVPLEDVPVFELISEAHAFAPVFALARKSELTPDHVEFGYHKGLWLDTFSEDDLAHAEIADALPEGQYGTVVERGFDGGCIRLWWESLEVDDGNGTTWKPTPMLEFRAYTDTGLEYFSAAVTLDWLCGQAREAGSLTQQQAKYAAKA
jgi:hypothetical protein